MTIELSENILLTTIPINEIIIKLEDRRQLDIETVNKLAESIEQIGLVNPITITEEKQLIAGLHRIEAYKKLFLKEIPCRIIVTKKLDSEKEQLILKLIEIDENLIRFNGHFIDQAEALLERKRIYEELYPETRQGIAGGIASGIKRTTENFSIVKDSFAKDTSDKLGVTERTIRTSIQLAEKLEPGTKEFIKEKELGKSEALLLSREEPTIQKQVIEKMAKGKTTVKTAIIRTKREVENDILLDSTFNSRDNIILDSLENILNYLEKGSVDLIVTDPPYPQEFLPLWQVLFDRAYDLLKEGGFLVTYTPHCHLPKIFQMRNELKYVWTIALLHSGDCGVFHPSKVKIRWKPLLIFVKGKMPERGYFDDLLQGSGREKTLHNWQQALGEAEELIELFSKPGALVIDPFLGSGTTAHAASNTNRRFFGMDNDPIAIQKTLKRLEENCHP